LDVYQRPEIRMNTLPLATSRTTFDSLFATYISSPLVSSACHCGGPSLATSSVGTVATTIFGGFAGAGADDVSAGTSFFTSAGGLAIDVHGPLGSFAVYQSLPPAR
jgi:hypothetical protein